VNLGQAIGKTAWQYRGSDRAKVVGPAGRGYDIELMGGDVARACISHLPDLENEQWVTVVQVGEGAWEIVGTASKAPRGDFAPEPEGS
jgi:hypothetical protein